MQYGEDIIDIPPADREYDRRIAVGGVRHETDTFSPLRTGTAEFSVSSGSEVLDRSLPADFPNDITVIPTLTAEAFPN